MDIKATVLDALDDLSSTRSSLSRRSRALDSLERLLAELCMSTDRSQLDEFLELQHGFECNIASRLLTSLAMCLPALQQVFSSASGQDTKTASEGQQLTQHTQQALSILQGVALVHHESKGFLGRKSSVHLLLDLLSISRHSPSSTTAPPTPTVPNKLSSSTGPSGPTLASGILDTLLCILVDSPSALRIFEEASGVEAVVKTLKRTGIAREVRMKCLEFLYFYLLPEDGSTPINPRCTSSPTRALSVETSFSKSIMSPPSKSVPGSPVHWPHPVAPKPLGVTTSSPELGVGSRTPKAVGLPGPTSNTRPRTPPASAKESERPSTPNRKSIALQMLQEEIDYEPVSPKKVQVARLGFGTPGKARKETGSTGSVRRGTSAENGTTQPTSAVPSRLVFPSFAPATPAKKTPTALKKPAEITLKSDATGSSQSKSPAPMDPPKKIPSSKRASGGRPEGLSRSGSSTVFDETTNTPSRMATPPSPTKTAQLPGGANWPSNHPFAQQVKPRIRSTEEKKELLGNWLGNVDALVEGVQKAGVWGLA